VSALLPALAAAALAAAPAAPRLLPDFTIALPPAAATTVKVVVPPSAAPAAEVAGFAAGPGAAWLLLDSGLLLQATRGLRARPPVPVTDVARLEGGGLAAATADALGFLLAEPADPAGPATGPGAPGRIAFQPLAALPVEEARLTAAVGGGLYVHGLAPAGGQALYLLAPEGAPDGGPRALRSFRRLLATTERIAAVAGDGETTYVATGKLVVRLRPGADRAEPVLAAREPITSLALSARGLLFYATPSGAGVLAAGGPVEFVQAPGLLLRAHGDTLSLLLRGSLAVVEVTGLEPLRPAARPAENARP
jgi:hypothetical protein